MSILFKAEAAVITRAGPIHGINGDNLNLNGKVLPPENADRGYKGAGALNDNFILSVCSGDRKSRAAVTALNMLNSYYNVIKTSEDNCQREIESFYNDARRAVTMETDDYTPLSCAMMYAYDDKIVLSAIGNGCIYKYSRGKLTKMLAESAGFGVPRFETLDNDLSQRNIYIICGEGASRSLSEDEITGALEKSSTTKQAVQALSEIAVDNSPDRDLTILVASVSATETFSEKLAPVRIREPREEDGEETGGTYYDDEDGSDAVKVLGGKKAVYGLLAVIFIILCVITALWLKGVIKTPPANANITTTHFPETFSSVPAATTTATTAAPAMTDETTGETETETATTQRAEPRATAARTTARQATHPPTQPPTQPPT
ncbi:MAG: hypothetical protein FWF08_04685, partial [Oscillospiraceae bacterium]|nr:hypothetical protein [Oscillospiraceae bacterium]